MLPTLITIGVITGAIFLWVMITHRNLVLLDENIKNAMSQIGIQLSSRFDALTALLDLTKGYAKHECEALIDTLKSERRVITIESTPQDVLGQERIISTVLNEITLISRQYPELKANKSYIRTLDAIDIFDNMVRTSRLIYNDGVKKLNYEIRMFPVSMIARMLGFKQKDYLVDQTGKTNK